MEGAGRPIQRLRPLLVLYTSCTYAHVLVNVNMQPDECMPPIVAFGCACTFRVKFRVKDADACTRSGHVRVASRVCRTKSGCWLVLPRRFTWPDGKTFEGTYAKDLKVRREARVGSWAMQGRSKAVCIMGLIGAPWMRHAIAPKPSIGIRTYLGTIGAH